MITRRFEQEWEQKNSPINNMVECNVIADFYEYLKNMLQDLKAIKSFQSEDFNKYSPKSIDHYILIIEKRIAQFNRLCFKPEYKNGIGFINSYEYFRDGIMEVNGNKHKIVDNYYRAINKIAESVFKIEDDISPIVELLWQNTITDVDNYDKDGEYFLLAHVDHKIIKLEDMEPSFRNYCQKQIGMCFSVITERKTRLYDNSLPYYSYYCHPRGAVGIIAKPLKGALIGASNNDMLSTEYIDNYCGFLRHFDHSLVNQCYKNGSSSICCKGTKVLPPKAIFNISVDTINEVILDSSKINVVSVFFVRDKDGKVPQRLSKYKVQQEELFGHPFKVIELKTRNKLNQINLEELYMSE